MSKKKYLLAFGIGVVAGTATALLYAPQSGARTRRQLRRGVEDAGDYLENAGDYLKAQAERLSAEAQRSLDRAVDRAGGVVSGVVKGAQHLM